MSWFLLYFFMALSIVSLNTGGCSEEIRNLSVQSYVDLTLRNPDIVLLQETYNLHENSSCWKHWPYRVHCPQGDSRGTGVVTLFKNNRNLNILVSTTLVQNHILYNRIELNSIIYHVYNVLIPQKDALAFQCIDSLLAHSSQLSEGFVIVGGDFNCTANPSMDRFCTPNEKRNKVAQALQNVFSELGVSDVWRRQNPTSREYTWFRNNPSKEERMSKARLDRIYISNELLPSVEACSNVPCAISDHSAVYLRFKVSPSRRRGSSHWHFNNSLLENKDYTDSVHLFWKNWQSQKPKYSNIQCWWDIGKRNIKTLSQMFGSKNAHTKRQTSQTLNDKIQQLQSSPDLMSHDTQMALKEQRDALRSLYQQEARGALIRARFQYFNEVDTCSSFFFGMEKSASMSKRMSKIRLPSGDISDDPAEINSHVHNFYQDLYSRAHTEEEACESLFQNIPTLDPCDADDCDGPFSLDELDVAVKQLGLNKSPGLDGLTSEFYQFFWPVLKNDLLSVFNDSILTGSLPVSCRRAIITLLPKKGDLLDVANWRPVSLLNTDYKIYAKVVANRLKNVIDQVVATDQSYSVPGRSIHDNIHLIRDSLMYCNSNNLPLALLNLDQKKAFDNVDHEYLFKTLSAMGFGQRFISYVRTMYSSTESLVKVGGSLTPPFPFEKGIRQGCPLSGLLYSIAIEPLLHTLRNRLGESGLHTPCSPSEKPVVVSAYADDITIFITRDRDFGTVEGVYKLYSQASAARLNLAKSQGLWAGSWVSRRDRPLDFAWNNEGLVFLGVRLGNSNHYVQQNWQECRQRIDRCLSSWKRLACKMSLKGRVLVANQLAASKLFHIFAALSPPDHVVDELQEKLNNFIWNDGKHWLSRTITFNEQDRGGLGLTCLRARILSFRFNVLRSFLAQPDKHPSFDFIRYYFRQYRRLGLDCELFATELDPNCLTHLPTFQAELMQAWNMIGARVATLPTDFVSVINLPINSLFFNELDREGNSPVRRLMTRGVRLVKHLLDPSTGAWKPADHFATSTPFRTSTRRLASDLKLFQRLVSTLSSHFDSNGCRPGRGDLRDSLDAPPPPPVVTLPPDTDGLAAPTKLLYKLLNSRVNDLPGKTITHWHRIGYIDSDVNIQWKNIYHLPTSKKEGDIQFRLFHNILPSLPVLHHISSDHSPLCGWCGERGTITHLFITCPTVQPSLNLLHTLLQRLLPGTTLDFNSYWTLIPRVRGRRREVTCLCNYLIISLKSVIFWLYQKSLFTDPLIVWRNRIQHKVMSEFLFYKYSGNLPAFEQKWGINNAIFCLTDSKITWFI